MSQNNDALVRAMHIAQGLKGTDDTQINIDSPTTVSVPSAPSAMTGLGKLALAGVAGGVLGLGGYLLGSALTSQPTQPTKQAFPTEKPVVAKPVEFKLELIQ